MAQSKYFNQVGKDLTEEFKAGKTYKTHREIDTVIVHSSASPQGRGDDAKDINLWHLANGWSGIGYHYAVLEDGTIQKGRWIDKRGIHAKGYNKRSIGVVWFGGYKHKKNATKKQLESLKMINELLMDMYKLDDTQVIGHNAVNKYKSCPLLTEKQKAFCLIHK